ncbi:hypothetical protein [Nocardia lasii]|uniref:DUF4232 domain-containing protein n=1 Tax=Nocardia lasii TaxID=1616107 RepID=A0ABW1JKH3_9NOCA
MSNEWIRAGAGVVFASGIVVAATVTGIGSAAAQTGGISIQGEAHTNCSFTITLTNHTNSRNYQPDWWFEEENDPAMVNATGAVADMPPPWRAVGGVPWPIARWVGDPPPLTSGVAEGVPVFNPPAVGYNRNAQPAGEVTTRAVDLRAVTDAPAPVDNKLTLYYRVKTGPVTADRLPTPQKLVVDGCTSGGGGSSESGSGTGSSGSGSFGSVIPTP